MSVSLNPDIGGLDTQSLCHTIYRQLYQNFFNAQDAGAVVEDDDTSRRLHNTAYDFASAIAGAVAGDAGTGTGGVLMEYLRKSGGDMSGLLRARYGFEAGVGNRRVIELFAEPVLSENGSVSRTDCGVAITGELRLGGRSLRLDGHRALSYDSDDACLRLQAPNIELEATTTTFMGDIVLGEDKEHGLHLSKTAVRLRGYEFYHAGNANLPVVDWAMREASVAGNLQVAGATSFTGAFRALHGAQLGAEGKVVAAVYPGELALSGNLSFGEGCGIRIGGCDVLTRTGGQDITLGAAGGDILLGSTNTHKVRLLSGIADADGEHMLLSPYGAACFPASLSVRHNYGEELLSSYRADTTDEGIVIHKRLRLGSAGGCFLQGTGAQMSFTSQVEDTSTEDTGRSSHTTWISHRRSTSRYAAQDRTSASFVISPDADFARVDVPLEVRGHLGIDGSLTRLADGRLDLTQGSYLLGTADGIRHNGTAYFSDGACSESFTAGFAGSGWAVQRNRTTGGVTATFDQIVVRHGMRVFEMEVQRITATNGALWVSDYCSGDYVEEL